KAEDLDKKLAKMFEHPIWDKVTKGCIGCGTCTFVCPTCYCFDIDSENYGAEGCKYRCWDSCMFSDYTRLAGGANPRPTKKERLRNRYMHKLSYFNERYGETLCVGCGRCVEKCPAHLDISEFIEKASAAELGKEDK
ncbi:MAG: 4Fe-4S dicluster domain-containing protein, partial [Lachnospiraceae bacterium]|nr:4Fe-4S dicluster domain-containing protein [Lachnospiraceae bacterium]